MGDSDNLHDGQAKYLQARIAALKAETSDSLLAFGESIGIDGRFSLDHMTPELSARMQAKVADVVSGAGNPALADRYRHAYSRAMESIEAYGLRLDDPVAEATADDALEDLERVEAELSAFLSERGGTQ